MISCPDFSANRWAHRFVAAAMCYDEHRLLLLPISRLQMQRRSRDSRINLEQAIAILIQNQAAFLASAVETHEWRRRADERFAKIERRLEAIERDLEEIKAILGQLPELIRQKIGFKSK
jgi:hypothetical protein